MNLKSYAGIPLLCLATSPLVGSEYSDLKRTDPVPATEQIPIVDFVRPELYQSPRLNHTGSQIGAIVADDTDHTSLITYDMTTQKLDGVGGKGDRDVSTFEWLDNNRLIYVLTAHKMGGTSLFVGEAGDLVESTPVFRNAGLALIAIPPKDRAHPLADLFADGPNTGHYDVPVTFDAMNSATVNSESDMEANTRHILERFPELQLSHGFNLGFWANKEGKLAYGLAQQDGVITLHKLDGDKWIKCPEDLDQISVIQAGDNPGEVTVLGPRTGTEPRPLEFMDARTGKPGEILLQDKAYDFDGWLFRDAGSHNIVGVNYDRAAPRVVWFTQAYRDLQATVDKLFPNLVVRVLGLDDAGKIVLISSSSDRQPAIYSWVDLEKHTSGLVKNSQPWIDPKRMRPMGVIKYKTLDGHELDAYVTLPKGASKKNPAPLVVFPHPDLGGRDIWQYNAWVQFLASRGYAVLQPNYRGSAGYGWMFPEQDEWEYRKMSDDVTSATKAVIDLGFVDRNRVAIMGNSFGGYLAVSGAAFEPDLYRCALSISAIYDWGKYIKEAKYRQYTDSYYSRQLYKLGDPDKNPEKFDAISPLHHASQIRAALFVAWGEYDNPESISQSKDVASAVQGNHVPVETMSFLDEGGGVHHFAHLVDLFTHIEAFLAKNMSPAAAAAGAP
jgi:dienelactone hydrolase